MIRLWLPFLAYTKSVMGKIDNDDQIMITFFSMHQECNG